MALDATAGYTIVAAVLPLSSLIRPPPTDSASLSTASTRSTAVCGMEDDFGFLSPELQQLTASNKQQQQQQQQQSIGQLNQHYPLLQFNQHSSRQTPPPQSHSPYPHHSNVAPLSPSHVLSPFSPFPLSSLPSASTGSSSTFPLSDELDGGLLPHDSYQHMLLSDVDLAPLGGASTTSPLASFDNAFLSSEGGDSGSGLSSSHTNPHRLAQSQNVQPLSYSPSLHMQPNTPIAIKSEHSPSPVHSYSQLQQQQQQQHQQQHQHQANYSHSHSQPNPPSRYTPPADLNSALSMSSTSSRSSPSPHGRSIDEYLALHAQHHQQQQQQAMAVAAAAAQQAAQAAVQAAQNSSHSTGQPSSSPVSAAASLLSTFQSSPPAGVSSLYVSSARSPHTTTQSVPSSRTISPTAPSASSLPSSGQYEQSGFSFPPPPPTLLGGGAVQLSHLSHSPQQHHSSLPFTTGYPAPSIHSPPSAVSSLVSSPPSTSPSVPHGHLRSRSVQLSGGASSPHAPNSAISPRMSNNQSLLTSHSHSPSAVARSVYPHLFGPVGGSGTTGGSAAPSLPDATSSSLSSSSAVHLQLQQAHFQRQLHASQMHQLQQQQQQLQLQQQHSNNNNNNNSSNNYTTTNSSSSSNSNSNNSSTSRTTPQSRPQRSCSRSLHPLRTRNTTLSAHSTSILEASSWKAADCRLTLLRPLSLPFPPTKLRLAVLALHCCRRLCSARSTLARSPLLLPRQPRRVEQPQKAD